MHAVETLRSNVYQRKKSENLISVVKELGEVIGLDMQNCNISYITRTAKLNPGNKRQRSIITKFSNTRTRDTFRDELNSTHLGYAGPGNAIFVMEQTLTCSR